MKNQDIGKFYDSLVTATISNTSSDKPNISLDMQSFNSSVNSMSTQSDDEEFKSYLSQFRGAEGSRTKESVKAGLAVLRSVSNKNGKLNLNLESFRTLSRETAGRSENSYSLGAAGSTTFPKIEYAQEGFEKSPSTELLAAQVQFNIEASIQDAFGELFFATRTLDVGVAGKTWTVSVPSVYTDYTHTSSASGDSFYSKLRNLSDAFYDGSVLENSSTKLVPIYNSTDATHATIFVPGLVLPNFYPNGSKDSHNVPTRPLAVGKRLNLLGLSMDPTLISQGVFTNTDTISDTITLKSLIWKTPGSSSVKYLVLDTSNSSGTYFYKSASGNANDMTLDFVGRIRITNETKFADMSTDAAIAALPQGTEIVYTVTAGGRINIETGYLDTGIKSDALNGHFHSARNVGGPIAASDASITAVITLLNSLEVCGYTLDTTRTNANLRTTGLIVHSRDITYPVHVGWKAPVSSVSSLVEARADGKQAALIGDLAKAARIRNTNDAVKSLHAHAANLKQNYGSDGKFFENRDNEEQTLPAAQFVMPYYKEILNIKLTDYVNSLSSADRNVDIQAALLNLLRKEAIEMIRGSRYDSALKLVSSNMSEKINVAIGTDQAIIRYLQVDGDNRTFGPNLTFQMESSPDKSMRHTVYMTFVRNENRPENDILSFGEFLWSPELVADYQVSVNGATVKRAMVFPRYHHQPLLPILVKITFDPADFAEAVQKTVDAPFTAGA